MWACSRRRALAAAALLGARPAASAEPGVPDNAIRLGQSTATTGPLALTAGAFTAAARACFEQANRQGGVHGRRIELLTLDDGYAPAKTAANVKALIETERVLALFGVLGVANTAAALPIASAAKVPLLFPMNGDAAIRRTPQRYLFTATASFEDEIDRLVGHLHTLGHGRVAVAHLANPFGQALRTAAERAAAQRGITVQPAVAFGLDGADLPKAAAALAAAAPPAVILGAFAASAVAFVRALRRAGSAAQVMTFSGAGADLLIHELADEAAGIVVSQIVPFPWSPAVPIVRDYRALAEQGGQPLSHVGLWGHVAARVTLEGLRRAGRDITREKLVEALESLKLHDIGQYVVDFAPGRHHGSRFVDITMIGRGGKWLK